MGASLKALTLACALAAVGGCATRSPGEKLMWKKLSPIPDQAGFGWPFAGVLDGKLLVAGGANFPDSPPWAGGAKKWHDDIFILSQPHGQWQIAGKLPRASGYGVSVTTPRGIICIGGCDAKQHFRDVLLLTRDGTKIQPKSLAPLPRPMAYGSGILLGETIYIVGGIEEPGSTNCLKNFWALNLAEKNPEWRELDPWPGPARMLAVVAAANDALYVVSGTELSGGPDGKPVRRYLTDTYEFRANSGWKRMADIPRAAVAAPSPAPVLDDGRFLVISGDDGTKLGFQPPEKHPGFARDVLAFDPKGNSWTTLGEVPGPTQVTVPVVKWDGQYVLPNGEIRPAVRTPEVWSLQMK